MATQPKEPEAIQIQQPDEMLADMIRRIGLIPYSGIPAKNLALAINKIATAEKELRKLKGELTKQVLAQAQQSLPM